MKKSLIALLLLVALVAGAVALVKPRQARNAAEPLPIIPPVAVATRTLTLEEVILTRAPAAGGAGAAAPTASPILSGSRQSIQPENPRHD